MNSKPHRFLFGFFLLALLWGITSQAGAATVSVAPATYIMGQSITFTVSYPDPITRLSGIPKIRLAVGNLGSVDINQYTATVSQPTSTQLQFTYPIVSGTVDLDGIYYYGTLVTTGAEICQQVYDPNTGLMAEECNQPSQTYLGSGATLTSVKIEATQPTPVGNVTVPAAKTYITGESLDFTVVYSEGLVISGAPYLEVTIEDKTAAPLVKQAIYNSAKTAATNTAAGNTNNIVFSYLVEPDLLDTSGVHPATTITVPVGASIRDGFNNDALLALTYGTTLPLTAVKVDSTAPVATGVELPSDGTHPAGYVLQFLVNYDEAVVVTGSPRLKLGIGAGTKYASFDAATSGTASLRFTYTIEPGLSDLDGIVLQDPKVINFDLGGTMEDQAGNPAQTDLSGFSWGMAGVKVDSIAPTVSGNISIPAPKTYKSGDLLTFVVHYSEPVVVNGTPQLSLTIGAAEKSAAYQSGTGTTDLTFTYQVEPGLTDTDGVVLNSSVLLNGGTIKDDAGNPFATAAALAGHIPAGITNVLVDSVAPAIIAPSVGVPANNTYPTDAQLVFTVTYDEPVFVTGSPYIPITVNGAATQMAFYDSTRSTPTAVKFTFTVPSGLLDSDGINVGTTIVANGGTMRDAAGNDAGSALAAWLPSSGLLSGVKIDSNGPTATGVVVAPGSYGIGQYINVQVTYNKAAYVTFTDPNRPTMAMTIGSTPVNAVYSSGSTGYTITFSYQVQSGNLDADGIALGSDITLPPGATIRDQFGNPAQTTGLVIPPLAGVTVDGVRPLFTGLTGPANGLYGDGDVLTFSLIASEVVNVVGTPYLTLDIGGTAKQAVLVGGTGSQTLTFEYIVQGGLVDADGIMITSTTVEYPAGATIRDGANNDATATLPTKPTLTSVKVDSVPPAVSATITGPLNGTYGLGQTLAFRVPFSEIVWVDTTGGEPSLQLNIAGQTKQATYYIGNGTSTLEFRYVIESGLLDDDGIVISGTSVLLNGGTIADTAGNPAGLSMTGKLPELTGVMVDSNAPGITGVTPPENGLYGAGQELLFMVTYNEPVTVTATSSTKPRIQLTIGATTKYAVWDPLRGDDSHLAFAYVIEAGLADTDGVTRATVVDLNGGQIKDLSLNAANNDMSAITPSTYVGVTVDSTAPQLVPPMTVPLAGTYGTGAVLDFVVPYNEVVTVSGTTLPRLELTIGAATAYAAYSAGSGTQNLTFSYTVAADLLDSNGIELNAAIDLNGGQIRDGAGNPAQTNLTGAFSVSQINIDSMLPRVDQNIGVPANKGYVAGETLTFTLHFDKVVNVNTAGGFPRLSIYIGTNPGSTTKYATYTGGTGTNTLTFAYTIEVGLLDTDGIQLGTSIGLNGGTIMDANSNPAVTDFGSKIPPLGGVTIDSGAPQISGEILIPPAATYSLGQTLTFRVPYSKPVIMTGVPQIGVQIGAELKYATYNPAATTSSVVGFSYTIETGLVDSNGVGLISPIDLNGGTIKDSVGNPADLVLTGHIPAAISGVLVDSAAAKVDQVIVGPLDGTYVEGNPLTFTAHFSRTVNVSATEFTKPRLTLTIDSPAGQVTAYASYSAGSGTQTLTFTYVVGTNLRDLNGIGMAAAIDLNGGTIKDTGGNNASILLTGFLPTNLGSVWIDSYLPILTTAEVLAPAPNEVVLTYSKTLSGTFNPGTAAFTVQAGGAAVGINAVVINLTKVTLTLARPIYAGEVVSLNYVPPVGTPLQDTSGNLAAALTGQPVTNNSAETLPTLTGAEVIAGAPSEIVLTYNKNLSTSKIPATSSFAVDVSGVAVVVNVVAINLNKVTLTLARPIYVEEIVTLSYTPPVTNPLQDTNQGLAAALTNQAVTNGSTTYRAKLTSTITNGVSTTQDGTALTYTVVIANNGPGSVTETDLGPAEVQVILEQGLQNFTFISAIPTGGATRITLALRVPAVSPIYEWVNMPAGSTITYKFQTTATIANGSPAVVKAAVRHSAADPVTLPSTGETTPGPHGKGVYGFISEDRDTITAGAGSCVSDGLGNVAISGVTYVGTHTCTATGTITAGPAVNVGMVGATANVSYLAGTSISLQPGFTVVAGSVFHASIGTVPARDPAPVATRSSDSDSSAARIAGGTTGSGAIIRVPQHRPWALLPKALQRILGDDSNLLDAAFSDASGDRVVFATGLPLLPGDTNGVADVYLYEVAGDRVVQLSQAVTGAAPNGPSREPRIDGNGYRVVYTSWATDLVAGDHNGAADIFLHDLTVGVNERISTDATGGDARRPMIASAEPLVVYDRAADRDAGLIYAYNHYWPAVGAEPLTTPFDDAGISQNSHTGAISADGGYLAYVKERSIAGGASCTVEFTDREDGRVAVAECPAAAGDADGYVAGWAAQGAALIFSYGDGTPVPQVTNPLY